MGSGQLQRLLSGGVELAVQAAQINTVHHVRMPGFQRGCQHKAQGRQAIGCVLRGLNAFGCCFCLAQHQYVGLGQHAGGTLPKIRTAKKVDNQPQLGRLKNGGMCWLGQQGVQTAGRHVSGRQGFKLGPELLQSFGRYQP